MLISFRLSNCFLGLRLIYSIYLSIFCNFRFSFIAMLILYINSELDNLSNSIALSANLACSYSASFLSSTEFLRYILNLSITLKLGVLMYIANREAASSSLLSYQNLPAKYLFDINLSKYILIELDPLLKSLCLFSSFYQ